MMVTGAIVYDGCYPLLSAEQKAAFIAEFVRLAKTLECAYPPRKSGLVIGHPSEWMILRDMLSAGIASYDENPEMYRLAAGLIFDYHAPARNWWYPSHAFNQGPGYADARFVSDMYAQWIFQRMGAPSSTTRSIIRSSARSIRRRVSTPPAPRSTPSSGSTPRRAIRAWCSFQSGCSSSCQLSAVSYQLSAVSLFDPSHGVSVLGTRFQSSLGIFRRGQNVDTSVDAAR